MVNEDPASRLDYFAHLQPSARDLPVQRFSRPQEIKGGLPSKSVRALAWSCDGKRIAAGFEYKGLRIWDVKPNSSFDATTPTSLPPGNKPSPHNGHVAALTFSPTDPKILLSGCKSSSAGACICIWDVTSPSAPLATFKIPGDVLHLVFHPLGQHFAVVCPRGLRDEVYFYSKDGDGEWARREDVGIGGVGVEYGSEEINSLRYSLSGKTLCAVSNDGSLNAWSYPLDPLPPSPSTITPSLPIDSSPPSPKADEPSGSRSGSRDGSPAPDTSTADIEMADAPSSSAPAAMSSSDPVATSSPPPLATPSQPPAPPQQKVRQLPRIRHTICHSASLLALAVDPQGRYIAVGGQDALLSLYDARDWICVKTYDVYLAAIRHVAFSSDGELIAIGGDDNAIVIVAVFTGAVISRLPVIGSVNALCWHPTRNWLAWSTGMKNALGWWCAQQD